MRRWTTAFTRAVPVAALVVVPLGLSACAAGAMGSPCSFITSGQVNGLTTRPAHVFFALTRGYGASTATVTQCTKTTTGGYAEAWQTSGRVGSNGFAAYGDKREGDGKSPTGIFAVGPGFGVSNPGAPTGYLTLKAASCWDETVGSPTYNTYVEGPCGSDDDALYKGVNSSYRQGLVIRYNMSPVVPGRGSGIFMTVGTGGPTAGSIATGSDAVVKAIRAAAPGDVIVLGVSGTAMRPTTEVVTHSLGPGSGYQTEVRLLQKRLNNWGYSVSQDGVYGSRTSAGVRWFQKKVGLPQTGTADLVTERTLGLR